MKSTILLDIILHASAYYVKLVPSLSRSVPHHIYAARQFFFTACNVEV